MKRTILLLSVLFVLLQADFSTFSLLAQDWDWQNPLAQGNPLPAADFTDPRGGGKVEESRTIRHTIDSGDAWTAQTINTTNFLESIFFIDPNIGWAVGGLGTIGHTTSGGAAWTLQTSGTRTTLNSVFFTDPNTGWAVSGSLGLIFHTTDGGATWLVQSSGTAYALESASFVDPSKGWVVGWYGTILHTTNGGTTWTAQTSGTAQFLYSVFFTDPNTGWAVGDAGTIRHTTSGGAVWTSQTSGTTNRLESAFFCNPTTGWAVGEDGTILHTTNGGVAWTPQTSGTTAPLYSVSFSDPNMGWAVGSSGIILHTTNGGATWTPQTSGTTATLYSVFFSDANTGWAVGPNGTVLHTTNGGTGAEPPPPPTLGSPPDGSTVSTNPLLIWNPAPDALWYTLQVSTSPYFITYALNRTNLTETDFQLSDLELNTTYYWRLSVTDATGTSNWSDVWSLTTSVLSVEARVTPKSGGESVEFGFRVTNNSDEDMTADIWVDLVNPIGVSKEILLRSSNEIPAGRSFNETKQIELKTGSIPGEYSFVVSVGTHPDEVLASATTVYTKRDSAGASLADIGNASNLATEIPAVFLLSQNYPNPFNPSARIDFALPVESHVKLMVYDILGSEVVTLLNKNLAAGYSSIEWNGTDSSGKKVVSGVYIYRMTAIDGEGHARFESLRKMILLK